MILGHGSKNYLSNSGETHTPKTTDHTSNLSRYGGIDDSKKLQNNTGCETGGLMKYDNRNGLKLSKGHERRHVTSNRWASSGESFKCCYNSIYGNHISQDGTSSVTDNLREVVIFEVFSSIDKWEYEMHRLFILFSQILIDSSNTAL